MRVCFISDTHNQHVEVPKCDLLIHSGDFSGRGTEKELRNFNKWMGSIDLPATHKIVIAGNHDFIFERDNLWARSLVTEFTYLQDELYEVDGLRIYGSPWQPEFFNWAFNLTSDKLKDVWKMIPYNLDILITHGPPLGVRDMTAEGDHVGCTYLLDAVLEKMPKVHAFGHIHEGYGISNCNGVKFVNASSVNLMYEQVNHAITLDL